VTTTTVSHRHQSLPSTCTFTTSVVAHLLIVTGRIDARGVHDNHVSAICEIAREADARVDVTEGGGGGRWWSVPISLLVSPRRLWLSPPPP
jgi:hypothetical protein